MKLRHGIMHTNNFMNEYNEYIKSGIKALDLMMIWSYPIYDSYKYKIIGNIHENNELIK